MKSRRSVFKFGLGLCAAGLAPGWAEAATPGPRTLRFHNLHTDERLTACYCDVGGYTPDALDAINRVLRDHRTNEIHAIDVRLLDLLHDLAANLETSAPLQVISGYRSPATNAALADASAGVARRSLHMDGMAIDIAIETVALADLRQAALDLQRGGVGFYPDPGFVHVDVGRVRRW